MSEKNDYTADYKCKFCGYRTIYQGIISHIRLQHRDKYLELRKQFSTHQIKEMMKMKIDPVTMKPIDVSKPVKKLEVLQIKPYRSVKEMPEKKEEIEEYQCGNCGFQFKGFKPRCPSCKEEFDFSQVD